MYQQLLTITHEAKELFLEGFYGAKEVDFKGTCDLITKYDLAVEALLKEKLSIAFPEHTIIAEESTDDLVYPDKAIYVDPIDGTTNFVHGIAFCAMSIGIWEDQRPVAGIVYNPVLDECYYAEAGKGATLNGEPITVTQTDSLNQSLIATGFPYTKVEKGDDFEWVMKTLYDLLPNTRDVRRFGSASIDLCLVARGVFDGYYELGLKPWDVSAGILILTEAGGRVSNENGLPYQLGMPILVSSNTSIHNELIRHTRE